MRIAIAQINLHVGNISGNADRIIGMIRAARDEHRAGLVVFPELTLTGYPPEDLLLRPELHRQVDRALKHIAQTASGIDVIVGLPQPDDGRLYNCCVYLRDGVVVATYRKRVLPNYGVFDEKRHFTPGDALQFVQVEGIPVSLSICEDLWTPEHARESAQRGAALLININASPYHAEKHGERAELLSQRVRETGLGILYVNLVGGQDELVFDGGSLAIDHAGKFALRAPQFEEGLYLLDAEANQGKVRLRSLQPETPLPDRLESIYQALVLGVRDYVLKNGFPGVVVGLSGGIDSALTLCLAVDALGAGLAQALIMPSRYTAPMSIEDAQFLCTRLGVRHDTISIEPPFQAFADVLTPLFRGLPADATEENIQARCRGILLMAISNKTGKMVLTTGNKSEMSVGYATLYGDMAGGFAPLKDVSKMLVYELAGWRNRDVEVIPARTIDRPPSAELRPDQKDEDSLPPYSVLDPILERYVERDQSPEEIIHAGFDATTVHRVVSMVDRAEYKRRQAAPGIKISKRAFGRDRRYPITSAYRES
ncbi:MAG: NAD+ synthase [Gammaproteobacteria bacterium]|nr:NAD+ synthase [Gammaproteobacteria bacterium]